MELWEDCCFKSGAGWRPKSRMEAGVLGNGGRLKFLEKYRLKTPKNGFFSCQTFILFKPNFQSGWGVKKPNFLAGGKNAPRIK